jgi:RNA recognition motif-containing protein
MGSSKRDREPEEADDSVDWGKAIRSVLNSSDSSEVRQVKKLRKMVLLTLQMDESDKSAKKDFKRAIKELEGDGTLSLDTDGVITVKEKKRKEDKKEKKSKKKKKSKKESTDDDKEDKKDADEKVEDEQGENDNQENQEEEPTVKPTEPKRDKPCKGNPQGVTRLFIGNLPFTVDENSMNAFLPGEVTHIKWITDKETGKFYGSAFLEMDNSRSAAESVAMAGQKLIGREVKINFAPAREGDVWPPEKKVVSGGGQAGGSGIKAMSPKPENCHKLFIGNLSYEIDDEVITKFFASVDAEIKAVRWLHHQETGDFKGW